MEELDINISEMWQSVILQAFYDAGLSPKNRKQRIIKQKAIMWLKGWCGDIYYVCELAGVDPNNIHYERYKILTGGK